MAAPARTLLLLVALGCASAPAAEWPRVEGQVTGEVWPTFFPGVPALQWKVSVDESKDQSRHVVAEASGPETRVRLELSYDERTGNGEWTLSDGQLGAKVWATALAKRFAGASSSLSATGDVSVVGHGRLRGSRPSGVFSLRCREGSLGDPSSGWRLDGVSFDGEFVFDAADGTLRSSRPLHLAVQTIRTSRFGARSLQVAGVLRSLQGFDVQSASMEIAGGNVVAAPFRASLHPLVLASELQFTRIGLQDLAQLVPNAVSEAKGRVDGTVHLAWSAADGFELGRGHLALRKDEPAEVRLFPSPGLITSGLDLQKDQYHLYRGLDAVELGRAPLKPQELEIVYRPEGDREGRQAFVHLAGTYPNGAAPLDLTINIRGPVGPLLKLSADPHLHFGIR